MPEREEKAWKSRGLLNSPKYPRTGAMSKLLSALLKDAHEEAADVAYKDAMKAVKERYPTI
jgi:hypothetical protein